MSRGDLLWLETPINPFGTHFNIESLAHQAHELGAVVGVDATFAPPPLFDPFKWGADFVMHSATKYLGGHSDLLAGVLVTKDINVWNQVILRRGFVNGSYLKIEFILAVARELWSRGYFYDPFEHIICVFRNNHLMQLNLSLISQVVIR